jgi:hypothetical protein
MDLHSRIATATPDGVARAGANKLLGVLPGRQHATDSLALLHQINA